MKRFPIACAVSALAASLTLTIRKRLAQIGLLSALASGLLVASPGLAIPATGSTAVIPTAAVGDPGDTRIVYTEVLTGNFSRARLVSSRPDGTDLRVVSHPGAHEFDIDAQISPDGRRVVFERQKLDDPARVFIVGADGRGEHEVDLGCVDPCINVGTPSWTPDGRRIAFNLGLGPLDPNTGFLASDVMYTARPDGSDIRRLSPPGIEGKFEDSFPRFSPTGQYLIFKRAPLDTNGSAVFRMRPDGTQVRQLTPYSLDIDVPDLSPATVGPTRDLVAFETFSQGGASQDVATVPATCVPLAACVDQIRNLTNNGAGPHQSFNPSWSPDGSRLAFAELAPGSLDVWTMLPNGQDRQQVTDSPPYSFRPDWGVAP